MFKELLHKCDHLITDFVILSILHVQYKFEHSLYTIFGIEFGVVVTLLENKDKKSRDDLINNIEHVFTFLLSLAKKRI